MYNPICRCPYVPCKLHGNCQACAAKSIREGTLTNCMEQIAIRYGARLPLRNPQTTVAADAGQLGVLMGERIHAMIREKNDALIVLPEDAPLRALAAELAAAQEGGLDLSGVTFAPLSDWLGLKESSFSVAARLMSALLTPLGLPASQLRAYALDQPAEQMCADMDQHLQNRGGIDLLFLTLGANGRVSVHEPGEPFDVYTKLSSPTADTITELGAGPDWFADPAAEIRRVGLGMHHVFDAKKVVLIASGRDKQEAVSRLYAEQPAYEYPGTVVKMLADAQVLLDEQAAEPVRPIL